MGKFIVGLQRGIGDRQVFQIGAPREVDGQGGAASRLAVAAGENKGDGRKTRGLLLESLAESGGEFGGAVVIEETKELGGETRDRFPALEGGLEEGLAGGNQDGQAAGGSRAQGLAF